MINSSVLKLNYLKDYELRNKYNLQKQHLRVSGVAFVWIPGVIPDPKYRPPFAQEPFG